MDQLCRHIIHINFYACGLPAQESEVKQCSSNKENVLKYDHPVVGTYGSCVFFNKLMVKDVRAVRPYFTLKQIFTASTPAPTPPTSPASCSPIPTQATTIGYPRMPIVAEIL